MANLTVLSVDLDTGANITDGKAAAAGGGDEFANEGKTFFLVENGGGSSITVTFAAQAECNYGQTHNLAPTVEAGKTEIFGPFDVKRFNNANDRVGVSYSGVTSVNVAPFKRLA